MQGYGTYLYQFILSCIVSMIGWIDKDINHMLLISVIISCDTVYGQYRSPEHTSLNCSSSDLSVYIAFEGPFVGWDHHSFSSRAGGKINIMDSQSTAGPGQQLTSVIQTELKEARLGSCFFFSHWIPVNPTTSGAWFACKLQVQTDLWMMYITTCTRPLSKFPGFYGKYVIVFLYTVHP